MPYKIICDGPDGPEKCKIVKRESGKTVAHAENEKDAGMYVAFASKKIQPRNIIEGNDGKQ